ncbi:hypothetical protein [Saccharibacillus brassicae]|uniref:Uncharacterized protein n=1 Tax=Saccharibacillus brassicae TaxID=2583377 RepID=A0A4Y6UPH0_SACBS|nr:hypothetical protein [Saccharibacillus brassicae]QDH19549.1 hypothetical protein FFV09_00965 [Saccharibacillus brassicae]
MMWQGIYSSSVTYNFGDVVSDVVNQNTYMCIADGTLNKGLSTNANWALMLSVAAAISNANTAASLADTARDNANTATATANTAAGNADIKAALADAKAAFAQTQGDHAKTQGDMALERGTSLVNKGTYSATTTYKPLNIVVYKNGVYQSIVQSTGIVPTNTANWVLLLQSTASVTWSSILEKPTNLETIEGSQAKVDAKAKEITDRLDLEKDVDVALAAGLQVVKATK